MKRILIALIALGALSAISHARILNVPEDYQTIQSGINAAEDGDTVLVQPGRYLENLIFDQRNIVVGSLVLITNDPAYIDSTVIDADHDGHGVSFFGASERSLIRGFTVRNGSDQAGGGIACGGESSPTLEDMLVTENHAREDGGGVFAGEFCQITMRRVNVIDNWSGLYGGGIAFMSANPVLEDCVIANNSSPHYGAQCSVVWSLEMRNILIYGNLNGMDSPAVFIASEEGQVPVTLDHLTLVYNRTQEGEQSIGGIRFRECDAILSNSIVYGNGGDEISVGAEWDCGLLRIAYSDIEGGEEDIQLTGDAVLEWNDNNLDADPLFIDPDNGDHSLSADSPCIDSGDPDAPPDPDGTRADMGAFHLKCQIASLNGRAYDALTEEPLPDLVVTSNEGFVAIGDSLGRWSFPIYSGADSLRVELTLRVPQYVPIVLDTMIHSGDSLWFESGFRFANFVPSIDSLVAEVDSGAVLRVPFSILNNHEGTLSWSAVGKAVGDAGLPFMSLRDSLQVSSITDDDRIEGAAFDGESFYLSGANGAEENLIYIVNREGALLRTFPQVGSSRYGYRDMDWDGENLWAVGEDSVNCLSREGMVIASWEDSEDFVNVAFDPVEGILWLSSTTSEIYGYDVRGNDLGRVLDNNNMRIYGLGCASFDPDGARLFVLNKPISNDPTTKLTKINTETGDTLYVSTLTGYADGTGYGNSFVCDNYDQYRGSVLLTLNNLPGENGGDRLDVYQLHANTKWLSIEPDHGEVLPGQEVEANIVLKTSSDDSLWAFNTGVYEGEVVFTHDGIDGSFVLPVTMRVAEPTGVESDKGDAYPIRIEVSAYPNPFNAMTRIKFSVGGQASLPVRLAIYDLSGRMVADLLGSTGVPAGQGIHPAAEGRATESSVVWNAEGLPGGIYLIRLESGNEVRTIKTVLLK